MALFIFVVFCLLAALGVPIGLVIGLTALFSILKMNNPAFITMLSQHFFSSMDSFTFLALPFFLLAGDIMNKIGLTARLVDFGNLFVGRLRGGLAQVNIVSSIIFGGISGAAMADVAALGSIFIPSMTRQGYGKAFASALVVASSIIAPIIPPSIIMVIYGAVMGVSVAGLFAAGIVPGLLIGAALMIITRFIAARRDYPRNTEPFTAANVVQRTKGAALALVMPVIILGGILGGLVTPTEAAAVAAGYALCLGFGVYRNLTLRDLYGMLLKNAVIMGVIAVIIASATVLAWVLAFDRVPEKVAQLVLSISRDRHVVLLLINVFLIFVGMFMDITAALLILAPILAPLAYSVGVDPLHFGIIMCVNLNMGLMTPPVGGCLFMAMIMTRLPMGEIVRELWPYLLAEFAVLFLLVFVPDLSMFVPRLLGFAK
jgi:TRAP-type transport system large permease protein